MHPVPPLLKARVASPNRSCVVDDDGSSNAYGIDGTISSKDTARDSMIGPWLPDPLKVAVKQSAAAYRVQSRPRISASD
jgi:hypothetical protein